MVKEFEVTLSSYQYGMVLNHLSTYGKVKILDRLMTDKGIGFIKSIRNISKNTKDTKYIIEAESRYNIHKLIPFVFSAETGEMVYGIAMSYDSKNKLEI